MRKVSVSLDLDVGRFVPPARAAADAIDHVDDQVESLDRSLDKIPLDAAKAALALRTMGSDAARVGDGLHSIGDKSTALNILDARIKTSRAEVRKLSDEFVKVGDVDVFKRLGKADADLRALQGLRKQLAGALKDASQEGASTFASLIQGGLINALKNPYVAAATAGIAGALAFNMVAAIGGAVTGAAGLGAVGLGVAGAVAGNPKAFGDAWTFEVERISKTWQSASAGFAEPTLAAIHELGQAVMDINLDGILSKAATFVTPLTHGLSGFVRELSGGLEALVDAAGPVINVLREELPTVGKAIKMAFESIAGGSAGGAQALRDLLLVLGSAIVLTGEFIGSVERLYGWLHRMGDASRDLIHDLRESNAALSAWLFIPDKLSSVFDFRRPAAFAQVIDGVTVSLDGAAHGAARTAEDLKTLDSALGATAVTADSLAGKMVEKLFNATMGLDQATLGWHESLTRLAETLKENGRSLDINTEKGQANREAILASVTANMQLYQAQLTAGMKAVDAAANYDANTAALERQLRKAGLTQAQIDGLIGKYRGVPGNVDTNIALHGLTEAVNGLADLIRQINGIPRLHITEIKTVFTSSGTRLSGSSRLGPDERALGGVRRAATGLIVAPSDPGTLIGEPQTGGEALIPLRGISQLRAMSLAGVVGASYGFDVTPRGGGMRVEHIHRVRLEYPSGQTLREIVIRDATNRGQTVSQYLGV